MELAESLWTLDSELHLAAWVLFPGACDGACGSFDQKVGFPLLLASASLHNARHPSRSLAIMFKRVAYRAEALTAMSSIFRSTSKRETSWGDTCFAPSSKRRYRNFERRRQALSCSSTCNQSAYSSIRPCNSRKFSSTRTCPRFWDHWISRWAASSTSGSVACSMSDLTFNSRSNAWNFNFWNSAKVSLCCCNIASHCCIQARF